MPGARVPAGARVPGCASARVRLLTGDPRAVGHDGEPRARAESGGQRLGEPARDGNVSVRVLPDVGLAPGEPRELRAVRGTRGGHEFGQSRRDLRRVAMRLVNDRCARRQPQQQRRHGEIAGHDDIRVATAGRARGGIRKVADSSRDLRALGRRPFHHQSAGRLKSVILERVARWRVRVWPHDQAHIVAAPGERMARLHGLDPVRALERQANVGEVEDLHEERVPMQGRWTRRRLL